MKLVKSKTIGKGQIDKPIKDETPASTIHNPRDLRRMLTEADLDHEDAVETAIAVFKHFLMDHIHVHRMSRDFEKQKVVSDIYAAIK